MADQNTVNRPTETISDRVYRLVRESLRSGAYAPGDKITHRTIASKLRVSVTPVREAITRLVSEGSLSMTGPKTIVAPKLKRSEFEEITDIRIQLEGWAVELAAKNATNSLIQDLRALHRAYCNARLQNDGKIILEANSRFHFRLYESSKAPKLVQIIDNLWVSNGPTMGLLSHRSHNDGDGQRFHEAAMDALERDEPKVLRKAIVDDITTGRKKILALLDGVA